MKQHQAELAEKLARERRKGLDEESTSSTTEQTGSSSSGDLVAYSDPSKYPAEVHRNKVHTRSFYICALHDLHCGTDPR